MSLAGHAQEALMLMLAVSLPVLVVAAVIGAIVAAFQAASQLQDPAAAHLPRVLAVAFALVAFGPWMAHHIAAFAERMFAMTISQ